MKLKIDRILGLFLVFLMAIMTLDVIWGVITRYLLGSQASWSEELARFLLIWIGILGAAYASGQKMHLAIDLLRPKLTKGKQKQLTIFLNFIIITFVFVSLIIGGLRLIYITNTLGQASAAMRIPMAYIYSILPISGLLIIYYKINELLNPISEIKPQDL